MVVRWRSALLCEDGPSPVARAVGVAVAEFMTSDGRPWGSGPTQDQIVAKSGWCIKTVRNAIKELEEGGWLSVKRLAGKDWRRNQYSLALQGSPAGGAAESPAGDAEQLPRTINTLETSTPSGTALPAGEMITVLTDDGPIEVEREWGGAASRLVVEWLRRYPRLSPESTPSDCPWVGEMRWAKRVWISSGPVDVYTLLRGASIRREAGILPGVIPGEPFGLIKVFGDPEEYQLNLKAGRIKPAVSQEAEMLAAVFADPESTRQKEALVA